MDSVSIAILANDNAMFQDGAMQDFFKHILALTYPLIIFDTESIHLGDIPDNSQPEDTTLFVYNKGGDTDSIFASIDYGTADSSIFSVVPSVFELAPGDSQAVTYTITPHPSLESKLYITKLIIDSKFSPITPSIHKPIRFNILYTAVEENGTDLPKSFVLKQNYPNPFNPTTTIRYTTPKSSTVSLKIINLIGQEITSLVHETQPAGEYEVQWNAGNLPSGVYICRFQAGEFVETKKLLLIK